MNLFEVLLQNYPVDAADAEAMAALSETIHVRKKDFLIKQGSKSNHIYFITGGLFRFLCEINGNEDTIGFGIAGDPFVSVHSLAHDEPSAFSLQAIENSSVVAVRLDDFRCMLATHSSLMQWWCAVLLEQIYALERRYVWLASNDASERYAALLRVRAEIINRIPIKYIAQYLNITPETLSRIRSGTK